MRDPEQRFSKSGKVMMDFCAGASSTPNTCISFDQYRKSVRSNVDSELLTAAEADPVLDSASQVLNLEYYICSYGEVKSTAESH